MSDFICINDRNQLPKYIPGYDTPEKAEAASLAMSANEVLYVEDTNAFGGPGSFIKTVTLLPITNDPSFVLVMNEQSMLLWSSGETYADAPPPVTLHIGGTNDSGLVRFTTITGRAIVTGYFTPLA